MTTSTTKHCFDDVRHRDAAADPTTDVPLDDRDDVAVAVDERERRADVPWIHAADLIAIHPRTPARTTVSAEVRSNATWLNYREAAAYAGYAIRYLRNLVSADAIPFYGPPRSRRFRRDMLDLYLTNRDAAMRKFRLERSSHHGE